MEINTKNRKIISNSRITISGCEIIGDNNIIDGSKNLIRGDHNIINKSNNSICGDSNIINEQNCSIRGDNNIINGSNCSICGDNNIINGLSCEVRGDGNRLNQMGKFNGKNNVSRFNIGNMTFTSKNCHNVVQGINTIQHISMKDYYPTNNTKLVDVVGNGVYDFKNNEIDEAVHLSNIDQIQKITDEKENIETLQCKICFESRIVITFNPCGDFKCCASCVLNRLKMKELNCPFCNQKIEKYIKTFI